MSDKRETTAGGQSGAGLLPNLKAEVEQKDYLSRETLEGIADKQAFRLTLFMGWPHFTHICP